MKPERDHYISVDGILTKLPARRPAVPSRGERRAAARKRKLIWRELPHLAARGNGQKIHTMGQLLPGHVCCVVVLPP